MPNAHPTSSQPVRPHFRELPLRVGTRASPLALWQTRFFLERLSSFCPVLHGPLIGDRPMFEEHAIRTTGDAVLDRSLADIGGKGLFAKEIHEALADGRIDFAVHSLKDLETDLPDGIVLACTLTREDARDALVLGPDCGAGRCGRSLCGAAGRGADRHVLGPAAGAIAACPPRSAHGADPRQSADQAGQAGGRGVLCHHAGAGRVAADGHGASRQRGAGPGRDGAGGGAGHCRHYRARRRRGIAAIAGGDRGPGGQGGLDRRTGVAGGAGRVLPHADWRPCADAAGWASCI